MIGQVSHVTLILLQLRESNVTIEIFELVAESEKASAMEVPLETQMNEM